MLDPACGSGNFLYVSLALLKALEKEAVAFAAIHGVTDVQPRVHPRQLFGLEVSPYAVELASIVIWIGYLQWKHRNVMPLDDEEPILQPLDQVQLRDAIVDHTDPKNAREPEWPVVDVVVGNPPFLGGKQLRKNLGNEEVEAFEVWQGRVARESDLCCYWFEKARGAIEGGRVKRVGLLATQGIRGGANRHVLERIKRSGDIFYAQADRKWIQDGVAVHVSMVGFDDGSETRRRLNQHYDETPEGALDRALPVEGINADLSSGLDFTKARPLRENIGMSFMGDTKVGPFEISGAIARRLLAVPNPDGRSNRDVVRPWFNGLDITRRPRDMWIVDFPPGTTLEEAALYEAPFKLVSFAVKPKRANNARASYATKWWIHGEPRPGMRKALAGVGRYLATPNLTKYRFFVWLPREALPDHQLIVFAHDDDYFFGVLHSRVHEVWARKKGTQLREAESGFRYTPEATFETFPFPHPGNTERDAIADVARELNALRDGWINPGLVDGLPLPEAKLKERTLTNLYNERPQWLANAHDKLDAAVFAAYGWPERPDEITDAEILVRLLKLNLEREPA